MGTCIEFVLLAYFGTFQSGLNNIGVVTLQGSRLEGVHCMTLPGTKEIITNNLPSLIRPQLTSCSGVEPWPQCPLTRSSAKPSPANFQTLIIPEGKNDFFVSPLMKWQAVSYCLSIFLEVSWTGILFKPVAKKEAVPEPWDASMNPGVPPTSMKIDAL